MSQDSDGRIGKKPSGPIIGVASGAGVGMIFGSAFGDPGVGLVLGAGIGLVIGAAMKETRDDGAG